MKPKHYLILIAACLRAPIIAAVDLWGMHEITLAGPSAGNLYAEVTFGAVFTHEDGASLEMDGFYDGGGQYKIRFMPTRVGLWRYITSSNLEVLTGAKGEIRCVEAAKGNRGPVEVDTDASLHFRHWDGTPYIPVGNTIYGMAQVEDAKYALTLDALDNYGLFEGTKPANKVRLCATPHWKTSDIDNLPNDDHIDKTQEPLFLDGNTMEVVNPAWFQRVDRAVEDLLARGIQAELILFHSNAEPNPIRIKQNGFETAKELTRYIVARYAAYRNVWWSMSNEFNFVKNWTIEDWDMIGRLIQEHDSYGHLLSIHNNPSWGPLAGPFPWGDKDYITHVSAQRGFQAATMRKERALHGKPFILDEYGYEGAPSYDQGWGRKTPQFVVQGIWQALISGCYATFGETYKQQFFRGGGAMHGQAPKRIAFMRSILTEHSRWAACIEPLQDNVHGAARGRQYYLYYYGTKSAPTRTYDLPNGRAYMIDLIDTWNMQVESLGARAGNFTLQLPRQNYLAIRAMLPKKGIEF